MSRRKATILSGSLREVLLARFRRPGAPSSDASPSQASSQASPAGVSSPDERSRFRRVGGRVLTVAAVLLIFAAMILPNIISRFERPGTYLRLPIEGFVAIGVLA